MPKKKQYDVRIATYPTSRGQKHTIITFGEYALDKLCADRLKLTVSDNKLYFIPDEEGLSFSRKKLQFEYSKFFIANDGCYDLHYAHSKDLYFIDLNSTEAADIDYGRRLGCTKTSEREENKGYRKVEYELEESIDEDSNSKDEMTLSPSERIVLAFLRAGLAEAIESENMEDIKAFHRILTKVQE